MPFKPNPKQDEATALIAGPATHILLEGGSRCVSGDTVIDGQTLTIAELAAIGKPVEVITSRGRQLVEAPFRKGSTELLEFTLESGCTIKVTPDHRFWDGVKWVKGETLSSGSAVAVRTCSPSPAPTTSASGLSESPEYVPRSMGIPEDLTGRYSSCQNQYGQRLRPALGSGLAYCASLCGVAGRSLTLQASHSDSSSGTDTNTGYQSLPAASHSGHRLFALPSTPDGIPCSERAEQSLVPSASPIAGYALGSRLGLRIFGASSFLRKSFAKEWDAALYRFCAVLGLSYDNPSASGYSLDKVSKITRTAKMDYYTITVPTSEQYFANGILHHNSSKTFELVWAVVLRAILAPGSRHAILRYRFNHVITSIWYDTFPKVMSIAFPDVKYTENKSSWFISLPGGSEIWFGGLDDKERTDKILGNEYATIFFNEVSQLGWNSVETALSRLAQRVEFKDQRTGETRILRLKAFYDQNPSNKGHFTFKIWHRRQTVDGKMLPRPDDYAHLLMNPHDNKENIAPGYIEQLESGSERHKRRFLRGEYGDDNPSALWNEATIDRNRVIDQAQVPEFVRVVVAVDPSGADDEDNTNNDEIGIGAVGLGIDGKAYVIEDNTLTAGPAKWGGVAVDTYDRLQASVIVGEKNFGGAMVEFVIQTAAASRKMNKVPFKYTVSSRGKHLRAEPVAALYEQNKVCHVGYHSKLEDEMYACGTNGYTGDKSPNRLDWLVFAITEIFPGIVAEKKELPPNYQSPFKARLAVR